MPAANATSDSARVVPDRSANHRVSDVFRSLAITTFIATLALIVVGGIVRVSDSGLGCGPAGAGIHGWPFCGGRVIPIVDTRMIIEYTHRALASAVGVLLIALAVMAWRSYRQNKPVLNISMATLTLVIAEGLLGALTVEHGLHATLVAIHLGVSMVIVGLLLALLFVIREQAGESATNAAPVQAAGRLTRVMEIVAPLLTWSTIVVGGYVAGTQKYGTVAGDLGYSSGAHMACSDQFPKCLGSWWPWGTSSAVDWQLTHRLFMYLTAIAVIWLAVLVWRRLSSGVARKLAVASVVVLGAQILLGAMNVWYGEHRGMILAHLTLGTILWLVVMSTAWVSRRAGADRY